MNSRRFLHFVLAMLGVIPWTVGYFSFILAIAIAELGHRLWPEADAGNCWSYVLPRWKRHGGYMIIREAPNVRLLKRLVVPHVIWGKSLDPLDIEQTVPLRRATSQWTPWETLYFRFHIATTERSHAAVVDPEDPAQQPS